MLSWPSTLAVAPATCETATDERTASVARTDTFCLPHHIESYAAGVFAILADQRHLGELDREAFVDRLTQYFTEINAIQPIP